MEQNENPLKDEELRRGRKKAQSDNWEKLSYPLVMRVEDVPCIC